jgi:hypothetical protein
MLVGMPITLFNIKSRIAALSKSLRLSGSFELDGVGATVVFPARSIKSFRTFPSIDNPAYQRCRVQLKE